MGRTAEFAGSHFWIAQKGNFRMRSLIFVWLGHIDGRFLRRHTIAQEWWQRKCQSIQNIQEKGIGLIVYWCFRMQPRLKRRIWQNVEKTRKKTPRVLFYSDSSSLDTQDHISKKVKSEKSLDSVVDQWCYLQANEASLNLISLPLSKDVFFLLQKWSKI